MFIYFTFQAYFLTEAIHCYGSNGTEFTVEEMVQVPITLAQNYEWNPSNISQTNPAFLLAVTIPRKNLGSSQVKRFAAL